MEISNLISKNFLDKFKVHKPVSLFPPTPKEISLALKEFKCPICMHRLYWNVSKSIARCKSIKRDKFFIRKEVLAKYI